MDERTVAQWNTEINRTLAAELIEEMSDADFKAWFDEHRAGMEEQATRRICDG